MVTLFIVSMRFKKLSNSRGVVPMYAVIMMLALPPIMTFFGYYTGYKKIDIYDKLLVLTFEKSDKSKE